MFISTLQRSIDVDHYQAFSKKYLKKGKILFHSVVINHLLHLVGILFPHIKDDAWSKSQQIYFIPFLGDSPMSEFHVPTFRNTLCVPS
jgi:uncharacterized membrane protein